MLGDGLMDQAWAWLAASAVSIGQVRAYVDAVQVHAFGCQEVLHERVDAVQLRPVEIAARQAGLVGDNQQAEAQAAKTAQALRGTRQELDLGGIGQVMALVYHGAIAVEQCEAMRSHVSGSAKMERLEESIGRGVGLRSTDVDERARSSEAVQATRNPVGVYVALQRDRLGGWDRLDETTMHEVDASVDQTGAVGVTFFNETSDNAIRIDIDAAIATRVRDFGQHQRSGGGGPAVAFMETPESAQIRGAIRVAVQDEQDLGVRLR